MVSPCVHANLGSLGDVPRCQQRIQLHWCQLVWHLLQQDSNQNFSLRYFSLHCWNQETSHRNICYIQTILNMLTQDYNWWQMKKKPKYHLTSTMCDRKNFVVTYWHTWYRTLYRWASNSTLANQHLRHRRQCSYSGCCHHQILGGPVKCEQYLRVHATILLSKWKQEAEHRWHAGF